MNLFVLSVLSPASLAWVVPRGRGYCRMVTLGTPAEPALRPVALPRAPAWGLLLGSLVWHHLDLQLVAWAGSGKRLQGLCLLILCLLEHLWANWRPAPSATWHSWVPGAFRPSLRVLSR